MNKISYSIDILKGLKLAGLASADVGQAISNLESAEAAYTGLLRVSQYILTRWQLEDSKAVFPGHAYQDDLARAINKVLSNA